jgi:hypothetical protein
MVPDEPMETFLNKINEICARMVTDPGVGQEEISDWGF